MRVKGKGNVDGREEDDLCVICMEPPEAPVKVRLNDSISVVKIYTNLLPPFAHTVAVRPQVLQEVHRGVREEGGGQIMPPLLQSAATGPEKLYDLGFGMYAKIMSLVDRSRPGVDTLDP